MEAHAFKREQFRAPDFAGGRAGEQRMARRVELDAELVVAGSIRAHSDINRERIDVQMTTLKPAFRKLKRCCGIVSRAFTSFPQARRRQEQNNERGRRRWASGEAKG